MIFISMKWRVGHIIAFTAADVLLRRNGFYIEVDGLDGYALISGSMERHEFRFAQILDWIRRHIKPLGSPMI